MATGTVLELINAYRTRGVLVDTNILLLHFVGSFDRRRITTFKRTVQFTLEDFDLLEDMLSLFARLVTTPNVLTEVGNLAGQLSKRERVPYFEQFARQIELLDERYIESRIAAWHRLFPRLGLTDASIVEAASNDWLVLTDDMNLHLALTREGIDAVNFNHIRTTGWS